MSISDLLRLANPLCLWPGDEESATAFGRLPLVCDGHTIGSIDPALGITLAESVEVFRLTDTMLEIICPGPARRRSDALAKVSSKLLEDGYVRGWRNERFSVFAATGGPKLFEIERAATRLFGLVTEAVHLNGLSGKGMWIARRSPSKAIDPGLLDNLVGGGVAAASTVRETLVKEAWEEAGIEGSLLQTAIRAATVGICRLTSEGLQREILQVYDVALPESFVPRNQDGEVSAIQLENLDRLAELVATHAFAPGAAIVILDFLMRRADAAISSTDAERLARFCRHPN